MASSSKKILLCVSGSIAAYKAADLTSLLVKRGHEVQCLLTQGALEFVTPTVLETLSRKPAQHRLFGEGVSGTEHIRLARWADIIVFAPATAHLLAKLRLGLADDLVTTVALASEAPWLVAPAMNTVMWNQAVTQEHVAALRARGARFVEPAAGILACGEDGEGKLAPVETIADAINAVFGERSEPAGNPADLHDRSVLITAGPTITPIDAVRYVTNPSTGKMGAALAEAALERGAEVHYVLGVDKGVVRPRVPAGAEGRFHLHEVRTAEEMLEASLAALPHVQGVIASAAVMDYRVSRPASNKLKRATESLSLEMEPSVDVLGGLRERARDGQWFFGFAAETDDPVDHGRGKLAKKRLDFLFANRVARTGEKLDGGFGSDNNSGWLLRPEREPEEIGPRSKRELADRIWDVLSRETRS